MHTKGAATVVRIPATLSEHSASHVSPQPRFRWGHWGTEQESGQPGSLGEVPCLADPGVWGCPHPSLQLGLLVPTPVDSHCLGLTLVRDCSRVGQEATEPASQLIKRTIKSSLRVESKEQYKRTHRAETDL